jgi:hypothetical protein
MSLDDGFHQTEPQAEAAFGPAPIAPEQPIPDSPDLIGWDSGTGVRDSKHGAAGQDVEGHSNLTAHWRVLHGVVDEVGGDLL